MSFEHPWALWAGAAAATLPVLVHLLTRPKPVRMQFSTLRFLRRAVEQRRARNRLRDFILLSLRTAAIILIAIAVARPKIGKTPLIEAGAPGDAVRVVLLDVSASMGASNQGVQRFEKARSIAGGHLSYQRGLRANVVLAGATPIAAFDRPTENLAALREEIKNASPTPERLNLAAALRRAGEILERTAAGNDVRRELVVVSDFQRSNWSGADFSAIPADAKIRLEYVDGTTRLDNVAVRRVELTNAAEAGGSANLAVELGNYSPAARRVRLEVRLGDEVQMVEPLLAANGKTTAPVEIACPQPGWRIGSARLIGVGDALASDDVRHFALQIRRPPVYLLATRQPGNGRGSSYFIERAAAPLSKERSTAREKVVRIAPEKLDREAIQGIDVVLIDHPGRLTKEAVSLLAEALRRGRGVLYFAAEATDAENLRAIAEAAGGDMKPPVDFLPAGTGVVRRNLFLADVRRGETPFRIFGDSFDPLAKSLRFGGGLSTRRRDAGAVDEVLATYSDGSASLISTAVGTGRLAVLNADLAASNLASSPVLVPLLGEWLASLRGRQTIDEAVPCGEGSSMFLPPEATPIDQLRIAADGVESGTLDLGELASDANSIVWRWRRAGAPGIYKVMKSGELLFATATATPAEEGDLAIIPPDLVEGRLGSGRSIETSTGSAEEQSRDTWWIWPAVACLLCLFGEIAALKVFRS